MNRIMDESFLKYVEKSIRKNWEKQALTDYNGATYTYKDCARKIEKLHILFETAGIEKGDKIAICSRNMSSWGIAFFAALTYGAVVVPILSEFKADNIHHIVNHSEAKLLFVGDVVWENLDEKMMPNIEVIIRVEDYTLHFSRNERLTEARKNLNALFGQKYPDRFVPSNVEYRQEDEEELALINYTSGTTIASKGVMLPYRSLTSNLLFAIEKLGAKPDQKIVSMLPMAHMYGLMFEFVYEFCIGMHVFFLNRTPSPKIIAEAFANVKPDIIVTVPLVIEKIIQKQVFPAIDKPLIKLMLNMPIINDKIYKNIHDKVMNALGGKFKELIIGGAALNSDVERFLRKIGLPFTVGYGMTECGPIIAYSSWKEFVLTSCGHDVPRMELKIDSPDATSVVGEILTRGANTMLGYYKNQRATSATIDSDGWLHTGDLGLIDRQGNLYIKGRSKNMILGASGQNIYPEEIEDKLNATNFISESIVIESKGKLIALVYPDFEMLAKSGIQDSEEIRKHLQEEVKELNKTLPNYCNISDFKIFNEEFEKTPKRSIKRFMYQEHGSN